MKRPCPDIMVVDDEPAVRTLMADVLRMKGYQPSVAKHALDALDQCVLLGQAPELLVTDVVMPPHANGVELVRRMRILRPDMKALYVSAYPADSEVSQAFGDPLSDFLPKPLGPLVLGETVDRMLDGTPGAVERDARRRAGTVLLMVSDPERRRRAKESLLERGLWVLEARHSMDAQFIGRCNEGTIELLLMDTPQAAGKGGWLRRLQSSHPEMQTVFLEGSGDRFVLTSEALEEESCDLAHGLRKLLRPRAVPAL